MKLGDKNRKLLLSVRDCFIKAEVMSTSVVISYYILLSLPPLIIIMGNLLNLIDISVFLSSDYITLFVPETVLSELIPLVETVLSQSSGGLLSLGIAALLWSAGRGVDKIKRGINRAYGLGCGKSYVISRIFSALSLISAILFIIVLLVIFGFGTSLIADLFPGTNAAAVFSAVRWPAALIILFLISAAIFRFSPDTRLRFTDILPGAVFSTLGMIILVQLFSLILKYFFKSITAYGTISSFFILMYWLIFMSVILLSGAVINAAFYEFRYGKKAECREKKHVRLFRRLIKRFRRNVKR